MPSISIPVTETRETITRPVAMGVIRDILKRIGVDPTKVRATGFGESVPLPDSTINQLKEGVRFASDAQIIMSFDEEYLDSEVNSISVSRPDQPFFFRDEALGIYIKPIVTQMEMTISVRIEASSLTDAAAHRKNLKRQISQNVETMYHRLDYHYPIPTLVMVMLKHFHTLRESRAGYNEIDGVWLANQFSDKMGVVANLAGRGKTFVIKETNLRAMGWWPSGSDVPQKDKGDGDGKFVIETEYKLMYDRVDSLNMTYPIQIHQQSVDLAYVPQVEADGQHLKYQHYHTQSSHGMSYFEFNQQQVVPTYNDKGIPVPSWDSYSPRYTPPYYRPLIRWLMSMIDEAPTEVIELTNLGDHVLSPNMLNFTAEDLRGVLTPYRSLILVQVYQDNDLIHPDRLSIDSEFGIRLMEPAEMRSNYRVVLSILSDPTVLPIDVRKRLTDHTELLKDYFETITGDNRNDDLIEEYKSLEQLWKHIDMDRYRHRWPAKGLLTVQLTSVTAKRR